MDDNSLTTVSIPPPPSFDSIQYSDESEFMSLDRLLEMDNIKHGVLATAIETQGIQGWDRYGRFTPFDAGSPEAIGALDLLADHYAGAEERAQMGTNGLDDYWEDAPSPYKEFGWKKGVMPDFKELQAKAAQQPPMPPKKPKGRSSEGGDLALIGALLLLVKGKLGKNPPHPVFKTETALIELLAEKMGDYDGLGTRTIQKKFAEAKRLVEMK